MINKTPHNNALQFQVKEFFMSQFLFMHWPDALLVVDNQGSILALNNKTEILLGYLSDELEGRTIHSMLCAQAVDSQHKEAHCKFKNIEHEFPNNSIIDTWFIQKSGIYLHVDIKKVVNSFTENLLSNQVSRKEIATKIKYYVLSFQDCTIRNYSEKELQRQALFVALNPAPIIEFTEQALISFSNKAMVSLIAELGFDQAGMPKVIPDNYKALISKCLLKGETINNIEVKSEQRWFLWNFHPILEHSLVQAYGFDITSRKKAEELLFSEKERFLVTLNAIDDAVIAVDTQSIVTYMNPKATELTGWKNLEAIGQPFKKIITIFNADRKNPMSDLLRSAMLKDRSYRSAKPQFLAHRDGYVTAIKQAVSPIKNHSNEIVGAVVAVNDISEAQQMEKKLLYQASHDSLTHLINRSEFEIRLNQSIEHCKNDNILHALLFMDLDNFKVINDSCGHTAGDQLLRQVSKILKGKVRRGDVLARMEGDEFTAILEGCNVDQALLIAIDICNSIQKFNFIWGEHSFTSSISIGLITIDESYDDVEQLLSLASQSCYAAKEMGRNRVHVYQQNDAEFLKKKGEIQWVSRINKALLENRFVLYFQLIKPINDEQTGLHFEILLRMKDEHDHLILPGVFLPAAEHYDLIKILDHWVVKSTFSWLNEHPEITKKINHCSINLSGYSIGDEHFMHHLAEQFKICEFSAEKICFEVTETAAISNFDAAGVFINTIKELGCSFSLDDFGSGMSSFAYLKQLNIDYLKIDGLFVKDIVIDPIDAAMVKSINEMGHLMGLKTIAEYAENDEILAVLSEIGVDFAQGYGISHPKPLDEIAQLL